MEEERIDLPVKKVIDKESKSKKRKRDRVKLSKEERREITEETPFGRKKDGTVRTKPRFLEGEFMQWMKDTFPDVAADVLKTFPVTGVFGDILDKAHVSDSEKDDIEFMWKQLESEQYAAEMELQKSWLEVEKVQLQSEHFMVKFARPLRQYVWLLIVLMYFINGEFIAGEYGKVPEIVWGMMAADMGLYTWKRTTEKLAGVHNKQ